MMTLEIPDQLANSLIAAFGPDVPRAALEAIAFESYREFRLSIPLLRRILGYETRLQADELLKKHSLSSGTDFPAGKKQRSGWP